MKSICHEGLKIVQSGKDLNRLGELLNESWKLKKLMNPSSTNDGIEDLMQKARNSGALGGKVIGAGGGGFAIIWCPKDSRHKLMESLRQYPIVPFQIYFKGSSRIL